MPPTPLAYPSEAEYVAAALLETPEAVSNSKAAPGQETWYDKGESISLDE